MYTVPVPAELRPSDIAKPLAVAGAGFLFSGWWLLFSDAPALAVLALALGFTLAIIGLVMWSRSASKQLRRTLSIILLAFGIFTFYMALDWGHGAVTLIALGIPALLLGIVILVVPRAAA
jgi:dipeptide/tripeptide permease